MSQKPLVSYIIGVRNMEDTIGHTIESILNQDYPNKEIIVINDGSDDNTEVVLKKYNIEFRTTEKIGISNARNLGYKSSKGEFIAFTDADCELDPNWTKNILDGFKDENVGLVGGVTKFRTDGTYSSIYRNLEFSKRYKNIKTEKVVWAGGPGSMFRRSVLEKIGGFNPKWVHGEDAEISFLTVECGFKVIKQNSAITYHVPESGFKRLVKKGLRDARAYTRVTKNHLKTSLHNKFNTTWYFPYDMIILPILYAIILISSPIVAILLFLNAFFNLPLLMFPIINFWIFVIIIIILFLFLYSLIPSFQVAAKSNNKKIKDFSGTIVLHHLRGFFWGIGLILGCIDIVFKRF